MGVFVFGSPYVPCVSDATDSLSCDKQFLSSNFLVGMSVKLWCVTIVNKIHSATEYGICLYVCKFLISDKNCSQIKNLHTYVKGIDNSF